MASKPRPLGAWRGWSWSSRRCYVILFIFCQLWVSGIVLSKERFGEPRHCLLGSCMHFLFSTFPPSFSSLPHLPPPSLSHYPIPFSFPPSSPQLQQAISELDSAIAELELQPTSEHRLRALREERAWLMTELNLKVQQRLRKIRRNSAEVMNCLSTQLQNCSKEQVSV